MGMSSCVIDMHRAPRFGHSSNIAFLTSPYQADQYDYINGIYSFAFLLFMIFFLWSVLLVCFKCMGDERAGCAAGGNVLDIKEIRGDPNLKPKARKIIQRSWKVQSAFFIVAFLIPIASGLFLVKGLKAVNEALVQIQGISDDIESVAMQAAFLTDSLIRAKASLATDDVRAVLNFDSYCPNPQLFLNMTFFSSFGTNSTNGDIKLAFQDLDAFLAGDLVGAQTGFNNIASATRAVDDAANFVNANDWILKMFALFLNMIVAFFFAGICLSRSNCIHYPFRAMLSYILVPIFCLMLVVLSLATVGFGVATVTNADFCAGGDFPGSPEGTIHEVIRLHGMSEQDLLYNVFEYYVGDCTTENPIHFVQPYQSQLQSSIDAASTFLNLVSGLGVASVSKECGANIQPMVAGVELLTANLVSIQANVAAALALSDCSTISPILRKIIKGEPCDNAVLGLTWMFSTLLALSVFCMTLISLRAALYNATIRAPKKERTDQWEWEDYKQYMAHFYDDAREWKFHGSPNKQGNLASADSFETAITTRPSLDTEDHDDDPYHDNDGNGRWVRSDDDDSISDSSMYTTPGKSPQRRKAAIGEMKGLALTHGVFAEVFEDEMLPLDPMPPQKVQTKTPKAPRKPVKSIQRTSRGMLAASKTTAPESSRCMV